MYAVGHTQHELITLTPEAAAKVRARAALAKKQPRGVFYRTTIKNEVWSFLETYDAAKGFQIMLHLDGAAS